MSKVYKSYEAGKQIFGVIKNIFKPKKVSPTITSVKPNLTKTVQQTKSDNYIKNIRKLDTIQKQLQTGRQMMKEAQKARKKMVDTGKAFQFKSSKSFHAMGPGDRDKYKASMKVEGPQKKFLKGKELEQKAKGGRVGLKRGTGLMQKKSNVQKIKETFGPKKNNPKMSKAKKKFPDLTGDGKVTFADVLKGRGVINGKNKKKVI